MQDDSDIPILTDLIDDKIDITLPELGLDTDHDLLIDGDDEADFSFNPEILAPPMASDATTTINGHPELEQTIRRILDEHMELAWQEIRLAIEVCLNDQDENF